LEGSALYVASQIVSFRADGYRGLVLILVKFHPAGFPGCRANR
jgi:hypothetical protein